MWSNSVQTVKFQGSGFRVCFFPGSKYEFICFCFGIVTTARSRLFAFVHVKSILSSDVGPHLWRIYTTYSVWWKAAGCREWAEAGIFDSAAMSHPSKRQRTVASADRQQDKTRVNLSSAFSRWRALWESEGFQLDLKTTGSGCPVQAVQPQPYNMKDKDQQ